MSELNAAETFEDQIEIRDDVSFGGEVQQLAKAPTGPTCQKLRRLLLEEQKLLLDAINMLSTRSKPATKKQMLSRELKALFCAYTDSSFPPKPTNAEITSFDTLLENGSLFKRKSCAIDVLQQELIVIEIALSGLIALNALGNSIPVTWSNLSIYEIARNINQRAKASTGRVIGIRE